jgi:hypothetical protein
MASISGDCVTIPTIVLSGYARISQHDAGPKCRDRERLEQKGVQMRNIPIAIADVRTEDHSYPESWLSDRRSMPEPQHPHGEMSL